MISDWGEHLKFLNTLWGRIYGCPSDNNIINGHTTMFWENAYGSIR